MTHLTRYYMYKRIKNCLVENDYFPMEEKILRISSINNFYPFINMRSVEL